MSTELRYNVGTLRGAGLEAKWTKTRKGAPILVARDPKAEHAHQRDQWWYVDRAMWNEMQREGVRDGFTNATLLGDLFRM